MVMRHWKTWLVCIPLAVYVLYVAGVALVLNTALFAKLTKMENPGETNIRFVGAYSLVPGRIRMRAIRLAIREPTVDLDIELKHARVTLDFRTLLQKRVRMASLRVEETTVALRMKSETDREEPIERVGKISDLEKEMTAEEQRRLKERWKIEVENVDLVHVPLISFDANRLRGDMAIKGAFMLQPGTQAEIFPSTFTIRNAQWNEEIREIRFQSEIRIHHFMKAKTSGSEVFRYLDARITGEARAENLKLLNFTLRSLRDYRFGEGTAALKTKLDVRAGTLLAGSFLRADDSFIRVSGPRFDISGHGALEWYVPKAARDSRLHAEIRHASAQVHFGENRISGSVRRLDANARILGLELPLAFTGLAAKLKVAGGRLRSAPVGKPAKSDSLAYHFSARVNGEVSAIAGDFPKEAGLPKPSALTIDLDRSQLNLPKLGRVDGIGRISVALRPIDFRFGRVDLPDFRFEYSGKLNGEYPFALAWTGHDTSRTFDSARPEDDRWRGSGDLKVSQFNGLLDFLSETDRISALVRGGLNATDVRGAVEWEVGEEDSWLRLRNFDSNGAWSGYGTLTSNKSSTRGAFEGKVLGIPIGFALSEGDVRVKVLPSRQWFEEVRRP